MDNKYLRKADKTRGKTSENERKAQIENKQQSGEL